MRILLRTTLSILITLCTLMAWHTPLHAQEHDALKSYYTPIPDQYFRAHVLSITETPYLPPDRLFDDLISDLERDLRTGQDGETPETRPLQTIRARITSGKEKNNEVEITQGGPVPLTANQRVIQGDDIVIVKTGSVEESTYHIVDFYRLPALGWVFALFFALVVFFGRKKGLGAIAGMGVSILILAWYIVPFILAGHHPLLITLSGALAIACVSLYLAHGFNARTSTALASTLLTLSISVGLATLFVTLARLFGTGSEDALTVQYGATQAINLKGLLLSGIIIGTLGVLDDITTAQTAVVDELHKANPSLSPSELYHRGLSVGREHIASLVNTLVLAYAGAALPLFLLFELNPATPFWMVLNSEAIAEEVIRTLVGSAALIIAVPLATFLAVTILPRIKKDATHDVSSTTHTH